MSNLNPGGLTRVLNYIKTWVTGLLNGKANSSHNHTTSQITDFPTIPSKTSQLTNDSEFITSEIDSSGTSWVRFKCGVQICWGEYNTATSAENVDCFFPKAFFDRVYPISVSVTGQDPSMYALGWNSVRVLIQNSNLGAFTYTAVGRWK